MRSRGLVGGVLGARDFLDLTHAYLDEWLDQRECEQQPAREGEDRGTTADQRVSTLSGRMSRTQLVSDDGVPERWAQIATASSVHGRKAPTSIGALRRTPGLRMPPSW